MTSSSSACAVRNCSHSSKSFHLCHCCQNYLCHSHLKEHDERQKARVSATTEKLSYLSNRLDEIQPKFLGEFIQWRENAHAVVDQFFDRKSSELDGIIHELKKKIADQQANLLQSTNEKVSNREHANPAPECLRSMEQQLDLLEHLQFHLPPLTINDNFILFQTQSITPFSIRSSYRTAAFPGSTYWPLATNVKHLLTEHEHNLYLFDRNLTATKKIPFDHGSRVKDMCWSSKLSRFIIINRDGLFLLDEQTMLLEQCNAVPEKGGWACVTCSDHSLLLSTDGFGSAVYEYSVRPSIRFNKEWLPPVTCGKDEQINDLVLKHDSVAAIIFNEQTKFRRIELRHLATLERIWSVSIGRECFRCCLVNTDQWMVIDQSNRRLLILSSDGKLVQTEKYDSGPLNAIEWDNENLVVGTKEGLHLHKIQF